VNRNFARRANLPHPDGQSPGATRSINHRAIGEIRTASSHPGRKLTRRWDAQLKLAKPQTLVSVYIFGISVTVHLMSSNVWCDACESEPDQLSAFGAAPDSQVHAATATPTPVQFVQTGNPSGFNRHRRSSHPPELVALTAGGESALLRTPDMPLRRNNRRYVPLPDSCTATNNSIIRSPRRHDRAT